MSHLAFVLLFGFGLYFMFPASIRGNPFVFIARLFAGFVILLMAFFIWTIIQ